MEGIRIHIIRTVPKTLQFTIFDKVKLFGMRCKFKLCLVKIEETILKREFIL
ncbi:hypothetical protein LEP1GSC038_1641 [Leptospira weilii str. 2006001855]|uniref:Uncharacterized protein n=2 Tax=Leptospira weilii TaxID=28184 RepID=M6QFP9_9LEPT|nr:hypothetical protein LEP1GSC038_1641 [Leptospira weilii str. 2006001855]EMN92085.1 hypothetical protein LEP1GSC108_3094 [Leptospira weilii str. UI 13098]